MDVNARAAQNINGNPALLLARLFPRGGPRKLPIIVTEPRKPIAVPRFFLSISFSSIRNVVLIAGYASRTSPMMIIRIVSGMLIIYIRSFSFCEVEMSCFKVVKWNTLFVIELFKDVPLIWDVIKFSGLSLDNNEREDAMEEKTLRSICQFCHTNCGIILRRSANGNIIVEGDPEHPVNRGRCCSKVAAIPDVIGSEDRLKFPLRKTSNGFEEVSWEKALEFAAEIVSRYCQIYRLWLRQNDHLSSGKTHLVIVTHAFSQID